MDIELREAVDSSQSVVVRLNPDLGVVIEWSTGCVEFSLFFGDQLPRERAREDAFAWFRDVTGLPSGELHAKIWADWGELEARCPAEEWGPTIALLSDITACEHQPDAMGGSEPSMSSSWDFMPAVIECEHDHLVRRVEFDSSRNVLLIEPFHGYRISLKAVEARVNGETMEIRTNLGFLGVRERNSNDDLLGASRFERLWDETFRRWPDEYGNIPEDPLGPVADLPLEHLEALVSELLWVPLSDGRARNAVERSIESIQMFVALKGSYATLPLRHIVNGVEEQLSAPLTMDFIPKRREVRGVGRLGSGQWVPINLRAAARVDWRREMRRGKMLALATDPAPNWWDLPIALRDEVIRTLTLGPTKYLGYEYSPDMSERYEIEYEDDSLESKDLGSWHEMYLLAQRLTAEGTFEVQHVDLIDVLQRISAIEQSREFPESDPPDPPGPPDRFL